jgi:hypothetical protein
VENPDPYREAQTPLYAIPGDSDEQNSHTNSQRSLGSCTVDTNEKAVDWIWYFRCGPGGQENPGQDSLEDFGIRSLRESTHIDGSDGPGRERIPQGQECDHTKSLSAVRTNILSR